MANVKLGTIALVATFLFSVSAEAEEPYDITSCFSGTVIVVTASEDLTISSVESRGISQSHHENKAFDNNTIHCVGLGQKTPEKSVSDGYCKHLDTDGDFVVGHYRSEGGKGKWEFLHGTGKWKGIKGGGTNRSTAGKPITKGTYQLCSRATGTFSVPK